MAAALKLISHKLCPYVQRAVIALAEKGVPFERVDIDLANKPIGFWLSPGKTPVLQVGGKAIFESAVILEYLEETQTKPLHPADPLARAEHRAWIEFGSTVLNDIAGFYAAPDEATFRARTAQLEQRFAGSRRGGRAMVRREKLRWSTPISERWFAISKCSTKSPTSRSCRESRSSRAGARRSPRGRRWVWRSVPSIRRCCAISSIGGIRGCRVCRRGLAPRLDVCNPDFASLHPGYKRMRRAAQRTLASRMSR